jgi:hypothetical protein
VNTAQGGMAMAMKSGRLPGNEAPPARSAGAGASFAAPKPRRKGASDGGPADEHAIGNANGMSPVLPGPARARAKYLGHRRGVQQARVPNRLDAARPVSRGVAATAHQHGWRFLRSVRNFSISKGGKTWTAQQPKGQTEYTA